LVPGGVLQDIKSTCGIESKAENSGEITTDNSYLAGWCDLEDLGRALNNRKSVKVSNVKITIVEGDRRRHDVALAEPGGRCVETSDDVIDIIRGITSGGCQASKSRV